MIYPPNSRILVDLGNIFNLGYSLPVRWYGLLTGLGFLVALLIIQFLSGSQLSQNQKNNLLDLVFYGFVGGIIGARLWFVILSWSYYAQNPAEIFYIWHGGQSIQGGFLGGLLAALIFYRIQK